MDFLHQLPTGLGEYTDDELRAELQARSDGATKYTQLGDLYGMEIVLRSTVENRIAELESQLEGDKA